MFLRKAIAAYRKGAAMTQTPTITKAPASLRFEGHDRRGKPIDRIVMHEPAVATMPSTVKTLQNKGLSVHYTIDRDGLIMEHCPVERYCIHAGIPGKVTGHNTRSIGLEFINRYYGHRVGQTEGLELYSGEYKPILVSGSWVDRAWSAKEKRFLNPDRLYIFPTRPQLEAGWQLVHHLAGGNIPWEWTGLSRNLRGQLTYAWTTVRGHDGPGIKAHAQWAHADGRVPAYYALLRHLGLSPDEAYTHTLQDSTSHQRTTKLPDL